MVLQQHVYGCVGCACAPLLVCVCHKTWCAESHAIGALLQSYAAV